MVHVLYMPTPIDVLPYFAEMRIKTLRGNENQEAPNMVLNFKGPLMVLSK